MNYYILTLIILPLVFLFGLLCLSQIIYPLFFALPILRRLEKQKMLKKPVPLYTVLGAPVIWSLVLGVSTFLTYHFFNSYLRGYLIALGIALIVIVIQIPKRNPDLTDDLLSTWGEYIKESGDNSKESKR